MNLNKIQIKQAEQIWQNYIVIGGEKVLNASREYTQKELDQQRKATIPEVMGWLQKFLDGETPLEEFKTAIDGINKRNRLWGFRAVNGQMFFNILTKNSRTGGLLPELTALLKQDLPVPKTPTDAKQCIEYFAQFTRTLGKYSKDLRGAPRVGSIPYFLSYFWQIQAPDKYPIYYTSMVHALGDTGIWSPEGNIAEDYASFFELNHQLVKLLSKFAKKQLHLWDIEHAFWFHEKSQTETAETTMVPEKPIASSIDVFTADDLPDSYIPPILSILPRLALNDEKIDEICKRSGKAVEKIFEERIAILFRMLGYETELLGQGRGRVPDGVAISQEFHYAIIYDAKVRQQAYTMGTDERAIREYIDTMGEKLRRRGMRTLYFMLISSAFTGDHDDTIRGLKIDTNVNEVLLVDVKALIAMLEGKLRNPNISLGPEGIQRLLAFSGILTESDVREFMEI